MLKSVTSAPAYNNVIIVNDYTTLADIVLPIVDLLCNSELLFYLLSIGAVMTEVILSYDERNWSKSCMYMDPLLTHARVENTSEMTFKCHR